MFIVALKILLVCSLLIIFFQDLRERAVWWFLFPIYAAIAAYLHFKQSLSWLFFSSILLNLATVSVILLLAFFYSRYKMKVSFLEAIGVGDIIFFLGLTLAFPIEAFGVILVFSMIFSLGLHNYISRKDKTETVPLAGYASFFIICIYLTHWFGFYKTLYFIG